MRLRSDPQALQKCQKSHYFHEFDNDAKADLKKWFANSNKTYYLEIGSGKGNFIWNQARTNPDINFIGLEKFPTVIKKALIKYEKSDFELNNLALAWGDANKLLDYFAVHSFEKLYLNFSDPWPKKRHAARRLIHLNFLTIYENLLKTGATVEFKTDNDDLFSFCLEELERKQNVQVIAKTTDLHALNKNDLLLANNVITEYENNFIKKQKNINKIIFRFK
ncbi:tRNA (guanosine(46)-N7)-methyltransferase TrmB [[Mycoplasma] testudinis]|uniref:tRNA (guanosine(46)-N7)-methyltransferase TrmB n=1 Tax=[Mycoplasma] testudinis TaxID=33924 RepID=UPI0004893F50|nr:tRNA (guanosine(46)-N7)-methyltransferase TrmB [[Mycoplasma] testudinis]